MENQKLLSNKDLLLKNFKEVVDNLKDCEAYIADVIVSGNINRDRQVNKTVMSTSADY
jgi:hypothetical protein